MAKVDRVKEATQKLLQLLESGNLPLPSPGLLLELKRI